MSQQGGVSLVFGTALSSAYRVYAFRSNGTTEGDIYLNYIPGASGAVTPGSNQNNYNFVLGARKRITSPIDQFFDGKIAFCEVYDQQLSELEIINKSIFLINRF